MWAMTQAKDIKNKLKQELQAFKYLCGTIKSTFPAKWETKHILKSYKVLAVPVIFLYSEQATSEQAVRRTVAAKMKFLRFVAGCTRMDMKSNSHTRLSNV